MSASLVGSEMCIRDSSSAIRSTPSRSASSLRRPTWVRACAPPSRHTWSPTNSARSTGLPGSPT
eukprot:12964018-Alexandrium_andersonii.AAC.1